MKHRLLFAVLAVVLVACVSPDQFKKWALATPAFGEAIDAKKGIVYVEYRTDPTGEDPEADANGVIKKGVHLCGAGMTFTLAVLKNDLKWRYDNAAQFGLGDVVTCTGKDNRDTCSHDAALEYDVTGDYTFEDNKLRYVVRIEGATISEEFLQRGKVYALQRIAALKDKTCP
ncbi:MAG: hypothetical protein KC417_16870 [Myxococcales bacterium]|nr:hypothetical protein [Myxococcales bacterium]